MLMEAERIHETSQVALDWIGEDPDYSMVILKVYFLIYILIT